MHRYRLKSIDYYVSSCHLLCLFCYQQQIFHLSLEVVIFSVTSRSLILCYACIELHCIMFWVFKEEGDVVECKYMHNFTFRRCTCISSPGFPRGSCRYGLGSNGICNELGVSDKSHKIRRMTFNMVYWAPRALENASCELALRPVLNNIIQ